MAVTVTGTRQTTTRPATKKERLSPLSPYGRGKGGPSPNGGGPNGDDRHHDDDHQQRRWTPDRYRLGMWVALASITMMFTALTSAYIVRAGMSNDWRPIRLPPFVLVSTALLLAGSFVIERAKRTLKAGGAARYRSMLLAALLLGLGFVASQLLAWRQLVGQKIYVSTNPHSSFFYVLTGLHGLHILGGLMGLSYLLLRASRASEAPASLDFRKQRAATDVVALYWHFMDGLWVYLFLLLFLWR